MDVAEARHLLSVDASASRADLKRAYHQALKLWHPDRALHGSTAAVHAHERTQRINASIPAGVLLFGLVWAVLAGVAGALETFVLS